MKSLLVLLVCLAVVINCERTAEEKKAFKEWAAANKKTYENPEKEAAALENFCKNKAENDAHNKLHDEGKVSFRRGEHQFSDLSSEEIAQTLLRPAKQQSRKKRRAVPPPQVPEGPKELDWRNHGLVGPVKNQGGCGSCWAMTVAELVEAAIRKANPADKFEVSVQNILDCAPNFGCKKGGFVIEGLNYVKENGIEKKEDYPYVQAKQTCTFDKSKVAARINETHDVDCGGDENIMKNVLAKVGPVGIGICATNAFVHFQGNGIFDSPNCCQEQIAGHDPLLIGYGTDPEHGDYWLIKNSWGGVFGVNGIGKLRRGVNICNIATNAIQYATSAN